MLFLGALSTFMLVIAVGVVDRWRWMFWLLLIAFLAGVLLVVRPPQPAVQFLRW